MIKKATVTDVNENKIKVTIKDMDNVVSDWINVSPQKCKIKIGDITHIDCEYTPIYSINDSAIVSFKNSIKGLSVIGKWEDK
ncbi:hypothetical protein [Clostridium sp. VAP51]|uniref:hypothetical protein n=1 Tax=Clostridium sp. VAP51 TaxID=2949978 RepID=UPI00207A04E9|nr:hypothetical protein [Clostridium sp. VAP51]